MKMISTTSSYAIRALLYLSGNTASPSAKDISAALNIPLPFLKKILGTLCRVNYIKARLGQHGGFSLNIKPENISLLDIITLFQGPVELMENSKSGITPQLTKNVNEAETKIRSSLESIKLL